MKNTCRDLNFIQLGGFESAFDTIFDTCHETFRRN